MQSWSRLPGIGKETRSREEGQMKVMTAGSAIHLMLIGSLIFFGPVSAGEVRDELRGPAFSDPSARQEMPAGWTEQKIEYKPENEGADIVVTLNQQFFEFMLDYIDDYARQKNLKIKVNRGTCGISGGMIKNKEGDIGAFCCPPSKTDRLPGVRFHSIGIHPISILVHPDNPIENLSFDQVRSIFQGDLIRWSEVGWKDSPIQAIARLHCKKRPGHWRLMLSDPDKFGPEIKEVGAIEDMFSLVADTPYAIGYEVMWMVNRQAGKVKALRIDGMSPDDLEHLARGEYPLYRSLSLTTWEKDGLRSPKSEGLVKYIIDRVEKHGSREGIIPVSRLREAGWIFEGDELVGEPL
jgi:ABC-type phosphate transport system substrate-binding protein